MTKYALVCLLLGAMADGQAAPPAPASNVAPDAPVITINGLCDHPSADKLAGSCKKVITRAQFELMVRAVQPNMPASARRQFATSYVDALVMEQKAHELGLDQGADFDAKLKIARDRFLTQELNRKEYDSSQISDQQIEDYYHQNPLRYVEADLTRILVPGVQQLPAPENKLSEAEELKRTQESEAIMKTEADKVRARAVAGEAFDKLQAEAFQLAGIKDAPPGTSMGKVRGEDLSPDQLSVMDLKTGEISPLLLEKRGYLIYKVGEKRALPLAEMREDIRKTLVEQHRQAEMDAILKSATPSLNETYFGK
jgi:hypothetical protein